MKVMEHVMSNQTGPVRSGSASLREDGPVNTGKSLQREGSTSAASMTAEVSSKAKELASDAADTLTQQTARLLDNQIGAGAELIGQMAGATRRVSEELKEQSPQVAELVRSLADRVDGYSDQLREQSVSELIGSARDFTRRQPALVFSLAAVAGFFAWRLVKATPTSAFTMRSPSIQPTDRPQSDHSHGARTY
jgi:hypothetical protein